MNIGMVLLLLPTILRVAQMIQSLLKGQASNEDWIRVVREVVDLIAQIPGVKELFAKVKPFIDGLRLLLKSPDDVSQLSHEEQRAAQNLVTLFDNVVIEMVASGTASRKTVDGMTMEELIREVTEE